jgi:hypothetical protein
MFSVVSAALTVVVHGVAHERRDVLCRLKLLVVFEKHEVVGDDRARGREQEPDVDLTVLQRAYGEGTAHVQCLELSELHPVRLFQPRETERPLRALRRSTEDHLRCNRFPRITSRCRRVVIVAHSRSAGAENER